MSSDIEKKIVEIEFENRNFEKGIKQSQKSIDELNQSLKFKGSEKGIEQLQKSLNTMDLHSISNAVKKISDRFSELGVIGTTTLMRITNAAITAGKNMVKSFTVDPILSGLQEYETQMNSVQTIMANTSSKGTTLDQVNAALNELNHYADKTIYNFTEMTRNIGTFTAAGVDLQTSVSAIQGIANLAAVSGSTSQQASTAMYQLSQALSTGTVRLMDWNSVVNAGMGGEVFQQALRKVSEELGTGAEAAIKAEGSFRDSLQTGWLTSEVLTETLKKFTTSGANEWVADYTGLTKEAVEETLKAAEAEYGEADAIEQASQQLAEKSGKNQQEIKDVLEMAKTAEDAATKVKTFSQLMDTLKESVQSGWTETWNTVIGDFEEAKELWTAVSDALGAVIQKSADLRNNMLKAWKALGGRTKLLEGLSNISHSILDIWESISQAFYDVFGIVGKELYEMTERFTEFTKELVVTETTMEDIKRVVRGVASILNILIQVVSAISKAVLQVAIYLKPLLARILHIFAILGDGITIINYILKQTQIFNRLGMAIARTLLLLGQIIENLLRLAAAGAIIAFRSIFLIVQAIVTLYSAVNARFGGIGGLILKVLGILAKRFPKFGKLLESLEPALSDFGKNLGAFFGSLKNAFGGVLGIIEGFASALKQGILAFIDEFSSLDSLSLDGLKRALQSFATSFIQTLEWAGVDLTALKNAFSGFGQIVSKVFNTILNVAQPILTSLIDMVNKLFSIITDKSVIAIVLLSLLVGSIFRLIEKLAGTFSGFAKSLTDNITNVSNSISGYFNAMAKNEKSKAIKNLAVSIALMAGSLLLLTFVDQEKLKQTAITLGVFAGGLVLVMSVLNGVAGWLAKKGAITETSMSGFVSGLLAISISMLLVIKAVSNMQAEMNKTRAYGDASFTDAMWSLIGAFAVLALLATTMSVVTSKWAPGSAKVAISYVIQLLAVVAVLKQLADPNLDIEKGMQGLIGVGLFLTAFLAVEVIASKFSSGGSNWMNSIASVLALRMLLNTMKTINEISPEKLMRMLMKSLSVIIAFRLVMKAASKVGESDSSKTIRATALAFLGLVLAMKILSKMSAEEILKGTAGVTMMLLPMTGLMLISKIGSKKIDAATKTILAMSGAIAVMALCAALLSLIDPSGLLRGTISISIMAAIMGGVIALTRFVNKSEKGIKTMKTMATIIGVLAVSAGILSALNIGGLIVAFAGITAVLGMMALVFLSLKDIDESTAKNAALALTSMLIPIAGISGALVLLSEMDTQPSLEAIGGLIALMLVLSVCLKMISGIDMDLSQVGALALSLTAMAIPLAAISGALVLLSEMDTQPSIEAIGGLITLMLAMSLCLKIMSGIDMDLSQVGALALGLTAMAVPLAAISGAMILLSQTDTNPSIETMAGFAVLLLSLSVCMKILGSLDPTSILYGCLGLLAIGVTLIALFALFGGLFALLGDGSLFVNGAQLLGECIGALIGGIIGGIGLGVAATLPAMGTYLSDFMSNMSGFISGSKDLGKADFGSLFALTGLLATMSIVAPLTITLPIMGVGLMSLGTGLQEFMAATEGVDQTRLDAISQMMAGVGNLALGMMGFQSGNLKSFGEGLPELAANIVGFCNALLGEDGGSSLSVETAQKGAEIFGAVAEVASKVPRTGGMIGAILGDVDLSGFVGAMGQAGPAIKSFHDNVLGLQYDNVEEGLKILKETISVASDVPNSGGLLGALAGENNLDAFAAMMAAAGPSIAEFVGEVKDVKYKNAKEALKILAETVKVAQDIPNSGESFIQAFVGDNTLKDFAEQMASAGPNIKTFIEAMPTSTADVNVYAQAEQAIEILGKIIKVASGIDGQSDWDKFWGGDSSLAAFGSDLAAFAPSFKTFWSEMSDVELGGDEMVKKTTAMVDFLTCAAQFTGLDDKVKLPDLSNLTGQNTVYSLAEGMVTSSNSDGTKNKITEACTNIVNTIDGGLDKESIKWSANVMISTLSNGMSDSVTNNASFYVKLGETILSDIGLGFMGKPMDELVDTLSDGLINGVKQSLGINSPSKAFQEIGRYIVEGLDLGLQNGNSDLKEATSRMSSTIENQFREDMGIHSPSALFSELGSFIIDGLSNGLSSGGSLQDILGNVLGGIDFGSIFGDYGTDMQDIFSGVFDGIDLGDFSMEGLNDGSFVDGLMTKIQDQIDDQGLTAEIDAVFDADALQSQLDGLDGSLSTTGTSSVAGATMDSFVNTTFDEDQSESGSKNTFSFVQNNYSPTELDRIAIYRQTRNQFAAMKEVISKI